LRPIGAGLEVGASLAAREQAMRAARRAIRQLAPCSVLWRRGLPGEVAFWENVIRTDGADWPEDYRHRFTAGAQIDEPLILDRLPLISAARVSILDVGAGPASSLGSALDDRELELIAVDPLADEYNRLLTRHEVEPPVRVLACRGEDILARFGPARFDVAYARNSVDHSADPARVVRNMLMLVRPGGFVILRHWRNEGLKAEYEELHQWNIDLADRDFVIWNARHRHTLAELGAGIEFDRELAVERGQVIAVLRRASTPAVGRP
jgi:SAM-dependent methyltransferase